MAKREKIGVLQAILTANAKQFKNEIADARKRLSGFGKGMQRLGGKMKSVGRGLSASVTLPIVGMGAMIARTAGQFEESMNYVRALTQSTGEGFDRLKRKARDLGRDTQFSASQAADAMGYMAQAGLKEEEILEGTTHVLNLAAAAKLELADATDRVLRVMSGYNLEVSEMARVNDVLAKTATSVNTTIPDLTEAFFKVGPFAKSAGMSFEQTAAVLGQLQDAGYAGEKAGTALMAILGGILKPGKDAQKVIDSLNTELTDSSGKMLEFGEVMKRLGPISENPKKLLTLFQKRGGPAMAALLGKGSEAVTELEKSLHNAGGEAERVAKERMKGLNGALKQLKSAFEELQIAIAESGLLDFLTKIVLRMTDFFREVSKTSPAMLKWGLIIAGVAAALGPLIWAAGLVVGTIGTIITVVAPVGAALLALATGPIGIVVAAVAGLALAWREWGDDLQKEFPEVTGLVKDSFSLIADALSWIGGKIVEFAGFIGKHLGIRVTADVGKMGDSWEQFKGVVRAVFPVVKGIVERFAQELRKMVKWMREEWESGGAATKRAVTAMVDAIKAQLVDRLTSIVNSVGDRVLQVGGYFKDLWDKVTRHSYVPNMVKDIGREFGRLGKDMVDPAALATGRVGDAFDTMKGRVKGALKGISDSLMSAASSKFSGFLSAALGGLFGGGGRGGGLSGLDLTGNGLVGHAAGAILTRPTMVAPGHVGGEAGPEALLPLAHVGGVLGVRGTIGDVNVTVVDQRAAGAPVDVQEESTSGGGKRILVFIRDSVRRGFRSGDYDSEMRDVYGLDRRGVRR